MKYMIVGGTTYSSAESYEEALMKAKAEAKEHKNFEYYICEIVARVVIPEEPVVTVLSNHIR